MTPTETAAMRAMVVAAVADAVAKAEQRLTDDISKLRDTDRRHDQRLGTHSGTHKDLAANVRASISEVKATTNEDLLRATAHLAGVIEANRAAAEERARATDAKLQHLYEQSTALAKVPAQTSAATAAAIDTKVTVDKGQAASRNRTIATIVSMIVIAVLNHFLKG